MREKLYRVKEVLQNNIFNSAVCWSLRPDLDHNILAILPHILIP